MVKKAAIRPMSSADWSLDSVQARMTAAMINVLLSFGSELYTLHHLAVLFYELCSLQVREK